MRQGGEGHAEPQWRLGADVAVREVEAHAALPADDELPFIEAEVLAVPPQMARPGLNEENGQVDTDVGRDLPEDQPNGPEEDDDDAVDEPNAPDELQGPFDRMLRALRRNCKSPQFRSVSLQGPPNYRTVARVDKILAREIRIIQRRGGTEASVRRGVKDAILAAAALIKEESGRRRERRPPPFVVTSRAVRKLRKKVKIAESLRNCRELSGAHRALIGELRRTRTSLRVYIATWKARVAVMEERMVKQRETFVAKQLREKFSRNPAKRVIEGKREEPSLEAHTVEEYFRKPFSAEEGNRPHSPYFNEWVARLKSYQESTNPQMVPEEILSGIIKEVLSQSRPWKAPGEDGIPAGVYKMFPSARKFLEGFIKDTLSGGRLLTEMDVRGRVILIYKSGDKTDPSNYRPISVLNTDYSHHQTSLAEPTEMGDPKRTVGEGQ